MSVCVLLLLSCQSSTPISRIEANPVLFRALPPEQQQLVQQGRICEGMNKDAVFLAWGFPASSPACGEKNGKAYERWVYTYPRAVFADSFGGWYDPWGRRAWGAYPSAHVLYVPEIGAEVTFQDGKVTAWERKGAER